VDKQPVDPLVDRLFDAACENAHIITRKESMLEILTEAIAAARAEGATVPCGVCEGGGRIGKPVRGEEGEYASIDWKPCPAPGCVDGRVDARLATLAIVEEMLREDSHEPAYYEALHDVLARAVSTPEPEETAYPTSHVSLSEPEAQPVPTAQEYWDSVPTELDAATIAERAKPLSGPEPERHGDDPRGDEFFNAEETA